MVEKAAKQRSYQRHKPEETTLYKLVQANWLSFKAQVESEYGPLPSFVVKEFEEYLACGILAHGFLRAQCETCHFEMLIAFSCKKRGICPSCGARRMCETAAHLVDSVLPHKNIRQWVLTFPIPLRMVLAVRPKILSRALDIAITVISAHYRKKAGLAKSKAKTGAVTLIQRFGGALNCNPHFHALFIDGSYELCPDQEPIDFHTANPPSVDELQNILQKIIKRLTRYLERQKIIVRDEEQDIQLVMEDDDAFAKLQASSAVYRFATGPRKGQKALVLGTAQEGDHNSLSGLVAKVSGFSLHAGVACKAEDRDQLERIARYIARPALSEDRLSTNSRGEVIYKFKKPWADGSNAIQMSAMEFMERLVGLIPRPRMHLTRYHGVLGPHYRYRRDIVPKPKSQPQPIEESAECDDENHSAQKRMHWARLLKRIYKIDVTSCPHCQGKVRIIAAIEEPRVIRKILEHLGLPSSPPQFHPARGPPLSTAESNQASFSNFDFNQAFPD